MRHNRAMAEDVVSRDELRTAIATRQELGADMEPEVIDAFVARIEARLAGRAHESDRGDHQKEMVLGSMAIAIPLLAIAAVFTGLAGVITVCVALVLIAIVSAR